MNFIKKTAAASLALVLATTGMAQAETMILASPQVPEGFDGDALKAHIGFCRNGSNSLRRPLPSRSW